MDAVSLESLQSLTAPISINRNADAATLLRNSIRLDALREAAIGVGARGGYTQRTKIINKALDLVARDNDGQYNFGALLIMGRIIPPVIVEERDIYTDGGATALKLAGISYKVYSQAHFTSRSPSWRQYLYAVVSDDVVLPSSVLLPQNEQEQFVWRESVAKGWGQGIEQADGNFRINLNRLNRDFTGQIRYHILSAKGMITLPVVAQQYLPMITDGDSMSLDETLLRIKVLPQFNGDIKKWRVLGNEVEASQRGAGNAPTGENQ